MKESFPSTPETSYCLGLNLRQRRSVTDMISLSRVHTTPVQLVNQYRRNVWWGFESPNVVSKWSWVCRRLPDPTLRRSTQTESDVTDPSTRTVTSRYSVDSTETRCRQWRKLVVRSVLPKRCLVTVSSLSCAPLDTPEYSESESRLSVVRTTVR